MYFSQLNMRQDTQYCAGPSFFYSWRVMAVYIAAVIWTPMISIRPFPPIRLDDLWLLLALCMQLLMQQKVSRAPKCFPFWGFLAFGASALLSTVLAGMASSAGIQIPDLYDSLACVRLAIVMWVAGSISLSTEETYKLLYGFVIASCLMYVVLCAQRYGLQPWAEITTRIWTSGSDKYLSDFDTYGFSRRAVGTIGNPNYVGYFVWGNAVVCLVLFVRRGGPRLAMVNLALLAVVVMSLPMAVFVLQSRSALVCYFISIVYCIAGLLLTGGNTRAFRLLVASAVALTLLGATWYYFHDFLPTRMAEFANLESICSPLTSESLAPRTAVWEEAIAELRYTRNVVFGFGTVDTRTIDNGYLHAFYRQGILGLAIVLAIWAWGLIRSMRGWISGRHEYHERLLWLAVGSCIVGSVFFELTAEGLMYAKTGPIIAGFFSLLQRPLHARARRPDPSLNRARS